MQRFQALLMKYVFMLSALMSVVSVALICYFLFANGIPAINQIGWANFLLGREWSPSDVPPLFGIFPMILGSLYITAGAIVVGVPVGILTAVFLAKVCPRPLYRVIEPTVGLLAGIPSVVYGFFGVVVLVPLLVAVVNFAGYNIMFATVEEAHIPRYLMGTAVGIISIMGYSPDGFINTLFGNWLDTYGDAGHHYIFAFLIGMCVVGSFFCWLIMRRNQAIKAGRVTA